MDFLPKDVCCLTCGSSRQPLVSLHTPMPCESELQRKTHWQCLWEVFSHFRLPSQASSLSQSTCERCTKTIQCAYLMHKLLQESEMAAQRDFPSREMVTVTVSVAMNGEQRVGGGGGMELNACDDREADRRFKEFFGSTLDVIKMVKCHEVPPTTVAFANHSNRTKELEAVPEVYWPPAPVEFQNESPLYWGHNQVVDMDNVIVVDPETYHVTHAADECNNKTHGSSVKIVVVDPNNNQLGYNDLIDASSAVVNVDTNLIVVDPNDIHKGCAYGVKVTRPMLSKEINGNQNVATNKPLHALQYIDPASKQPRSDGEKSEQTMTAEDNPEKPFNQNDQSINQEMQCIRYESTFSCSICLEQKSTKGDILLHLIYHHKVTQNAEKYYSIIFKCPACPKLFNAKRFVGTHYTLMHGSGKGSKQISNEIYICDYCGIEFQFKTGLNAHKRSCRLMEPIKCSSCGSTFKTLTSFEEHLRDQHGVEVLHECEICRKSFQTREYLSKHRKRHMERHHECRDCGMTYIAKSELKRHKCPYRLDEPADSLVCVKCKREFATPLELQAHQVRTHIHKCKTCGQEFDTQYQLRKHSYEHTGRPYNCAQCNLWFERRIKMQMHAKQVHKVIMTTQELNDMHQRNMGRPYRVHSLASRNADLMLLHNTEEEKLLEEEMQAIGFNINDMGDIF